MQNISLCSALLVSFVAQTAAVCFTSLQRFGTIDSYRRKAHEKVLSFLDSELIRPILPHISVDPSKWRVDMPTLAQQLDQGVGSIELDLFHDPVVGHYKYAQVMTAVGGSPVLTDPKWLEPGIKVMHTVDADYNTHCILLADCLLQLRNWSDSRAGLHLPVIITMQLQGYNGSIWRLLDNGGDQYLYSFWDNQYRLQPPFNNFTMPVTWGADGLTELQDLLLGILGADNLVKPDDLRGYQQLGPASTDSPQPDNGCAWPPLEELLGRFVVMLEQSVDSDLQPALDWYTAAVAAGDLDQLMHLAALQPTSQQVDLFLRLDSGTIDRDRFTFSNASQFPEVQKVVQQQVQNGGVVLAYAGVSPTPAQVNQLAQAGASYVLSSWPPTALSKVRLPGAPAGCHVACNAVALAHNPAGLQQCERELPTLCLYA